ncbi:MAG: ArnT family glycosyltransferase [Nitrospinota bacterium]
MNRSQGSPVVEKGATRRYATRELWIPFLLGLAMSGLFILWQPLPIEPSFEAYDRLARNWLRGDGFSIESRPFSFPDLFRTPGYVIFLVPLYWLFGPSPLPVQVVQAFLHAAVPLLLFFLVRRAFSGKAAFLAALLVALYPLTAVYVPAILADMVSVFVTVLSVWTFLWTTDRPTAVRAGLLGIVFGFGTLLRPAMALLSPFMFLGAWAAGGRLRGLVKPFFIAHLTFTAVLAPWTIRNYRVSGEFIPLSIETPLQLWLATLNYGPYTDRYWTHPLYHPQRELGVQRRKFIFDRRDKPYPVEARVHLPEKLVPLYLHYRINGEGRFRRVTMRGVGPDRFRAEIPPQPWGTRVRYFLTARDPRRPSQRINLPTGLKDEDPYPDTYYRVVRNVLEDLGEEVLDLNFISRLAEALNARAEAGGAAARKLDADGDGLLSRNDIHEALAELMGGKSHSSFRLSRDGGIALSILFRDGSRLDLPRLGAGDSVYRDLLWKPLSPPARTLLMRAKRRKGGSSVPLAEGRTGQRLVNCIKLWKRRPGGPHGEEPFVPRTAALSKVPCYWSGGIEPVTGELRRYQDHRFFFWENLRRWPMSYLGGSLLRIPRIWVIVGRSQEVGQTYVVAGGGWVFPALTAFTLGLLAAALAGYVIERRTWRTHWYLAAPVVYISLIHAPFHPEARYSLAGRPFLLVYCALTLLAVHRLWRRRGKSGKSKAGS